VLIKVLPSGVAGYLSPFKDVYGSRLIFAGPHRSFTKGNDEKYSEMSNAVFLIRERILEDMNDEVEQRCYAITTNEKLGLTINPHPINEEDIVDCSGEVEDDFESGLDDHQRLNSILEHQGKVCGVHMEQETWKSFQQIIKEQINLGSVSGSAGECSSPVRESNTALVEDGVDQDVQPGSVVVNTVECNSPDRVLNTALDRSSSKENYGVFKAKVPMAKFRNAMDDEDSEDGGGFRCAECSKCLNCKTSSKRTAISLREAREQQLIEESVKIDVINRRVTVNFPFLKNPVEFLTAVHSNPSNYSQALKVYKTQCKKSEIVKDGMRNVHKDLVEKGFMVKLDKKTSDNVQQEFFPDSFWKEFSANTCTGRTAGCR